MKLLLLFAFAVSGSVAHAMPSHSCQVFAIVQRYDAATMKFKSATEAKSNWFEVTSEPHEDPKKVDINGPLGKVGVANVWTGTLLGTSDGDLIQAHATFSIEGVDGSASLLMSLDSRLAQSSVVLDTRTQSEFLLIPIDLKCLRD